MELSSWVPILCYHDVVPKQELAGATPYAVSEDRFAAHMRTLHQLGYRTISLSEAARLVRDGVDPPRRSFAITFDDGYAAVRSRALPALEALGYTATAYLVAGHLLPDERPRDGRTHLDREDVRALQAAGWELGSHTCSHPDLVELSRDERAYELVQSRRTLQELFDDPVSTFCYPYHRRTPEIEGEVAAAGYSAACGGYASEHRLFDLARIDGAAHGVRGLLLRCSRAFWRARTNPGLRVVKRAVDDRRLA